MTWYLTGTINDGTLTSVDQARARCTGPSIIRPNNSRPGVFWIAQLGAEPTYFGQPAFMLREGEEVYTP